MNMESKYMLDTAEAPKENILPLDCTGLSGRYDNACHPYRQMSQLYSEIGLGTYTSRLRFLARSQTRPRCGLACGD